jgi:VWFA-related protein
MKASGALIPGIVLCGLVSLSCPNTIAQGAANSKVTPFKFKVDVNKVLVPVVVRDKQGRALEDLKKADFQVFDNEQPRAAFGFTVEKRAVEASNAGIALEGGAERPDSQSPPPQSSLPPQRFILFLFDDLHLSFEDLVHAQKAAAKLLDGELASADLVALGSTSGMTTSGFSRDRSQFGDAMMRLRPRNLYRSEGAIGMTDVVSGNNPVINRPTTRGPEMTPAKILAEQDIRATFDSVTQLVRRMADLPGQRMLILASPGFPIPRDDMEGRTRESQLIDLAAGSNVTIGALDARGLYGSGPNLGFSQEDVMAELADGTGGTFFHNSNDLAGGFKQLTDAPEVVYVLELSLDGVKADGSYHRLKVKVNREGVELQARHGYSAPQPDKKKN